MLSMADVMEDGLLMKDSCTWGPRGVGGQELMRA